MSDQLRESVMQRLPFAVCYVGLLVMGACSNGSNKTSAMQQAAMMGMGQQAVMNALNAVETLGQSSNCGSFAQMLPAFAAMISQNQGSASQTITQTPTGTLVQGSGTIPVPGPGGGSSPMMGVMLAMMQGANNNNNQPPIDPSMMASMMGGGMGGGGGGPLQQASSAINGVMGMITQMAQKNQASMQQCANAAMQAFLLAMSVTNNNNQSLASLPQYQNFYVGQVAAMLNQAYAAYVQSGGAMPPSALLSIAQQYGPALVQQALSMVGPAAAAGISSMLNGGGGAGYALGSLTGGIGSFGSVPIPPVTMNPLTTGMPLTSGFPAYSTGIPGIASLGSPLTTGMATATGYPYGATPGVINTGAVSTPGVASPISVGLNGAPVASTVNPAQGILESLTKTKTSELDENFFQKATNQPALTNSATMVSKPQTSYGIKIR